MADNVGLLREVYEDWARGDYLRDDFYSPDIEFSLSEDFPDIGVEPGYAVLDLGPCREHQHRQPAPGSSQAPAHLEPVEPGHEHVEDDGVGLGLGLEARERLTAVGGELDLVPLELQRAPERLAHGTFVVDD